MKYISIDIETTGLDPEKHDILEIGAIIEDTKNPLPREKCPTFHCYIDKPIYRGDPFALAMNYKIFQRICEIRKARKKNEPCDAMLIQPQYVTQFFSSFLDEHGIGYNTKVLFAGKNFLTFDKKFLDKLEGFSKIPFHHRIIDPACIYTDFINDELPANLETCKQRAGIENTEVTHCALDDAWDVIQLIRNKKII